MKKIILAAALLFGTAAYQQANAQISLNINIGSQPDWGPVGYDHVDYYYMPDVDAYYDVPNHQYIYLSNNTWTRRSYLPAAYNFNPYTSYKVVVNEPRPWTRATVYRTKYASYKGRPSTVVIRDSRDVKYKDHWKPAKVKKGGPGNSDFGHSRGKGKGHDKGNGKGHGKH
ncbi:MAG: hypothetical protein V4619_08395 [Bacteroidota bacterium]